MKDWEYNYLSHYIEIDGSVTIDSDAGDSEGTTNHLRLSYQQLEALYIEAKNKRDEKYKTHEEEIAA